jgi:hypothetical protein
MCPPPLLADLQDARRPAKPWLPPDDRDVTNGLVTADAAGKPGCGWHGAMNRVDPHRLIYRCQEMLCGVGAEIVPDWRTARCAQCEEPGDPAALYPWWAENAWRYICRNASACITRQLAQQAAGPAGPPELSLDLADAAANVPAGNYGSGGGPSIKPEPGPGSSQVRGGYVAALAVVLGVMIAIAAVSLLRDSVPGLVANAGLGTATLAYHYWQRNRRPS